MPTPTSKEQTSTPRTGEVFAAQPLSGTSRVDSTNAVNGMGHGGFVRVEKSGKKPTAA